ncbi:MAG: RNA polymerase-binding protein RbpA [Actinobacteria bacterium]|nr:RNA polymerase-binding protein RbpA [Actinomycetota bacterium]
MAGSAIRGSRVGAGPMGEAERGEPAPRVRVSFYCANGHESRPTFAVEAGVPTEWDCPKCGFPAGTEKDNPPVPIKSEPYKTHLAYVKERRNDTDGEAILAEALAALRGEI